MIHIVPISQIDYDLLEDKDSNSFYKIIDVGTNTLTESKIEELEKITDE